MRSILPQDTRMTKSRSDDLHAACARDTNGVASKATATILVVDDEPEVREVIAEFLSEFGYRVVQAADGAEALRVLAMTPKLDLIVSDVRMPGISGIELAEQATRDRHGLKVILISGFFIQEKVAAACCASRSDCRSSTMPCATSSATEQPARARIYEGGRSLDGARVTVDGQPLDPRYDIKVFNRTGFEWTYAGDGPRQLALALLADHLTDPARALSLTERFMITVVAELDNAWRLTSADIDAALAHLE